METAAVLLKELLQNPKEDHKNTVPTKSPTPFRAPVSTQPHEKQQPNSKAAWSTAWITASWRTRMQSTAKISTAWSRTM